MIVQKNAAEGVKPTAEMDAQVDVVKIVVEIAIKNVLVVVMRIVLAVVLANVKLNVMDVVALAPQTAVMFAQKDVPVLAELLAR